jgi:cytoskeleton protein RodZ
MNPTDAVADTAGPGARLRQARHDLKLAPEDAAQILRLSPRQILALENDDYASLPGPTYVRGYLRSYAQLLGLAPEKIVEIYNGIARETAPAVEPARPAAVQAATRDNRAMLAGLAILGVVLALSAVWWTGREPVSTKPSPPQSVTYQTESGAVVTETQPPVADGVKPGAEQPVPMVPANVPAPAMPPKTITMPTPSPAPAQTAVSGAVPPAAVSAAPSAPAVTAAVQPAATPGTRARLVLRVEQESWADIRDARQNRLLYETIPAGRTVTLEGVAPLSVFLGNIDGVRMEYNGTTVDTARHKRGGPVARFTLGENGAAP